jgi:EAL domain-containing protein (putative c-di-GMP-specific phosphodiesterase class I)
MNLIPTRTNLDKMATSATTIQLEAKLEQALERNEFRLEYQPQINIDNGAVAGFEALLRWQPKGAHDVSPWEFIPLLESSGLINRVGAWIIDTACAHWREWTERRLVSPEARLGINVSACQFAEGNLVQLLEEALRKYNLDPASIEIELTESAVMLDTHRTRKALRQIRRLGIGLSMDDFGTGYATMAYLRRFRFDTLKIDRSFIQRIRTKKKDLAIAMSMIQLAHILELRTVVEGVETPEQLASLRRMGCGVAQGHYFARPLPAGDIPDFLRDWRGIDGIPLALAASR